MSDDVDASRLALRWPREDEEGEFERARLASVDMPSFLHYYADGMDYGRYLEVLIEQDRGVALPTPQHVPSTFLFAFVVVLGLVRGGQPVVDDEDSRGVMAGVRYLWRDPLLRSFSLITIVLDGAANGITVAVPLLAYTRYDRNPHIAGWIFTAFGIGAITGSVLVMKLLDRFSPLKLAAFGIAAATLPLWIVVAPVSWPVVGVAVVLCGLFVPMVNAPIMGIITTRPPAALRAKVMTAVMAASGSCGPLGRIIIGPLYRYHGNAAVWTEIAGGMTVGAIAFVFVAWRAPAEVEAEAAAVTA